MKTARENAAVIYAGEHDQIVLGDYIAAGAESIAVERCADDFAIGEGD